MFKESTFLIKIKVIVDVLVLTGIVLATRFLEFRHEIFSESVFTAVLVNVLSWLLTARAFGLYHDLRMKPISVEWVMFLNLLN